MPKATARQVTAFFVPLVVLLAMAGYIGYSATTTLTASLRSREALEAGGTIGEAIHALQTERGRAPQRLADPQLAGGHAAAIEGTDAILAAYGRHLGGGDGGWREFGRKLDIVRRGVQTAVAREDEIIAGYSMLIQQLEQRAVLLGRGADLAVLLGLSLLRQLQEAYGRERVIGVGALQRGTLPPALDEQRRVYQAAQQHLLDTLLSLTPAIAEFEGAAPVPPAMATRIAELRAALEDTLRAGTPAPQLADHWFAALSDMISHQHAIERRVIGRAVDALSIRTRNAWLSLLAIVVATGGCVATVGLALYRYQRDAEKNQATLRKLHRAVEQSPVSVIITSPAGVIEYANPAFCRTTGWGLDEVIGNKPSISKSGATPAAVYRDLWQTVLSGQEWRGELCNRRRDGSLVWEDALIAPVCAADGGIENIIGIKLDITGLKALQDSLAAETENTRRVLDAVTDGIMLVGRDYGVEYANPAMIAEFGQIAGRRCHAYVFGSGIPCAGCEAGLTGGGTHVKHSFECQFSDRQKTFEISTVAVPRVDGSIAHLRVFHNVTLRKRAERALREAACSAELANRSKSEFIANMSHELRTPLNAIIGFTEMMQVELFGPLGDAHYRAYVDDVVNAARHLLGIINDILDLSRIDAGRLILATADIDLVAVVRAAVRTVSGRAGEAGISLALAAAPDRLPTRGDETRLKQAVCNLLVNGIKYTPPGGVVEIAVLDEADGPTVRIRDTGIGMDPQDIPKALMPFSQLHEGLARRYDGTGLGLPLTKGIVELHGGALTISSVPGQGTTATIRLPKFRAVAQPRHSAASPPAPA